MSLPLLPPIAAKCIAWLESGMTLRHRATGQPVNIDVVYLRSHRTRTRTSPLGEPERVDQTGLELAVQVDLVVSSSARSWATYLDDAVIADLSRGDVQMYYPLPNLAPFSALAEEFDLPSVPSRVEMESARRERYRQMLLDIPRSPFPVPRFTWKPFQLDDLSALALLDGGILAWDMGLGKSLAAFAWPLLKAGIRGQGSGVSSAMTPDPCLLTPAPDSCLLTPGFRTLIVAPQDLHQQLRDTGRDLFGIRCTALDGPEAYLRQVEDYARRRAGVRSGIRGQESGVRDHVTPDRCPLTPVHGLLTPGLLAPGFYLTSYTQLCRRRMGRRCQASGIRDQSASLTPEPCLLNPESTLADLASTAFDCVVIDEGVRIKGTRSLIGQGVRKLRPKYRLVLTGTPIKNRLRDFFWLAWWASGN